MARRLTLTEKVIGLFSDAPNEQLAELIGAAKAIVGQRTIPAPSVKAATKRKGRPRKVVVEAPASTE